MRKLISFIGNNEYKECVYYDQNNFTSKPTKFVQTALFQLLEHEGENIDEVYLFITKEAAKKNYYDSVTWERETYKGLKSIWKQYFPDHVDKLKTIDIPSDQLEADQWVLFEKIYSVIKPGDEIYFDITHSFRSIPMITLLGANFARVVQNATIKRLLYGNFDAVRKLGDIDSLPVAERKAPIVDITSMYNLFDWTIGVQSFLETGNPNQIDKLAEGKVKENYRDQNLIAVKRLTSSLNRLNHLMESSRGLEVHKTVPNVKENINRVKDISDDVMPQFSKLMDKIEEKVDTLSKTRYENMWGTIKWCADHGLHQQAYTFAREYIVSVIYDQLLEKVPQLKIKNYYDERQVRDNIVGIILSEYNPEIKLKLKNERKFTDIVEPTKEIIAQYSESLKSFQTIVKYRNNINHAEKAQIELPYTRIHSKMDGIVKEIKSIFYS